MKPWRPERRAKFEATIASRPRDVRQICAACPRKLTAQDLAQGCVRCRACRRADLPAKANPDKPINLDSWWAVGMSRAEEAEWFARAARELDRMSGSREARSLGFRKAVEEHGSPLRGPATS